MHQKITVVHQHPFGLVVAFHADRKFSLVLELQPDLVGDGLDLARVGARAHHKIIGERGNPGQV